MRLWQAVLRGRLSREASDSMDRWSMAFAGTDFVESAISPYFLRQRSRDRLRMQWN